MKLFPIKELERLSGIKAHVIRTWEQRFHLFTPQRAANNTRLYEIADIELLLNIGLLQDKGYKISALIRDGKEQIEAHVLSFKDGDTRQNRCIHQLIISMFSNDTEELEAILDRAQIAWGIDVTIEAVIMPFLERVNILSYNDTSIETHFVVTAIRRKLILGIEKLSAGKYNGLSALLYLPQGEHYDLVLLYINYMLKCKGLRVFYLGTDISLFNLDRAIIEKQPDLLYTYTAGRRFPHEQYQGLLKSSYPGLKLFVGHSRETALRPTDSDTIRYFSFKAMPGMAE